MFSNNGEPLRIVVETVPHDVVARLEEKDKRLEDQVIALRSMLHNSFEVIGELKREIRSLQAR